jgi:glycosyltransferase involved in cell wall biosynthesis
MAKARQLTLCLPLPVMQPPAGGFDFREHLDIPKDAFVILYMFDIHSTIARKNPQASVAAFLEFAKNKPDVFLILKIGRWQNHAELDLSWLPSHSQIKLITDTLMPEHLSDLYRAVNCYLSMHRSEGFGRTLIEALQHNLELIACDYSGPADFLTSQNTHLVSWKLIDLLPGEYPHAIKSKWANPSVSDAIAHLERLFVEHRLNPIPQKQTNSDFYTVTSLAKRYQPILASYLN